MPVSIPPVSRREFLQWSLAVGAAMALPRVVTATVPMSLVPPELAAPVSDHIALISDVHVSGGFNGTMAAHLKLAVEQVLALPQLPQRVIVAGDCAYLTGGGNDYQEYIRRIQPLLDAKLPIDMTLGNHDCREHFWDALPTQAAEASAKLSRQSMVVPGHHANWILLDSLDKTNHNAGELGKDQLEWLAAELDARAEKPAIVLLHHEPLKNGKKGSLIDSERLLDIVRPRRQVKALVFGHTHIWDVAQDRSGIHLVNLPATGYTLWMKSFLGWVDCNVYSDCATLTMHTLDAQDQNNGITTPLKWRV